MSERLLVCLFHAGCVSLSLYGWITGRFALGLLAATNIVIVLAHLDVGGLGKAVWAVFLQVWLSLLCPLASGCLLAYFAYGDLNLAPPLPGPDDLPRLWPGLPALHAFRLEPRSQTL